MHQSKEQLGKWKEEIDKFLREKLKINLHPDKSKILPISGGIDFVGFRNFYHFRLLRKRNIRNMEKKVELFGQGFIDEEGMNESFKGWKAYARWSDSFKLCKRIELSICSKSPQKNRI